MEILYINKIDAFISQHLTNFKITKDENWVQVSTIGFDVSSGYKIHVSLSIPELIANIEKILKTLLDINQSFKIPASLQTAQKINNGEFGATQVGKIITIYLSNDLSLIPRILCDFEFTGGPIISNEWAINSSRSVYIRYGGFKKNCVYDVFGRPVPGFQNSNGLFVFDDRSKKTNKKELPSSLLYYDTDENVDALLDGKYIRLKLISSTIKSKVFFGISLKTFEEVVIKVVPRGFGGDENGVESVSKIKNEYEVLSSTSMTGVPRACYFSESRSLGIVVTSYVNESISFNLLTYKDQLLAVPKVFGRLRELHRHKLIHGDLKPSNILISKDEIFFIDFETANFLNKPYSYFGTKGYVLSDKHFAEYCYEIDYLCLISMLFGIYLKKEASSLPHSNLKRLQAMRSLGYINQAEILETFTNKPEVDTIEELIKELVKLEFRKSKVELNSNTNLAKITQGVLQSINSEVLLNPEHTWQSNHLYSDYQLASINIGSSGTLLAGLVLSTNLKVDPANSYKKACEKLSHFDYGSESNGLYTGKAGQSIVLALAARIFDDETLKERSLSLLENAIKRSNESDLFSGMAGILYSTVLYHNIFPDSEILTKSEFLYQQLLSDVIIEDGAIYWPASGALENNNYPLVGLAHGSIGIAFSIYKYSSLVNDSKGKTLSIKCLKQVLRCFDKQTNSLKRYFFSKEPVYSNNYYWCHGIIGYLWAIGQLDEQDISKFDKHIRWCLSILEDCPIPLNPTVCHGLAGVLETYMLYLNNVQYREAVFDKILILLDLLDISSTNAKGIISWPSENPTLLTPDYMVGYGGTAVVISQYLNNHFFPVLSPSGVKNLINNGINSKF